jgi:hypothetical protein
VAAVFDLADEDVVTLRRIKRKTNWLQDLEAMSDTDGRSAAARKKNAQEQPAMSGPPPPAGIEGVGPVGWTAGRVEKMEIVIILV